MPLTRAVQTAFDTAFTAESRSAEHHQILKPPLGERDGGYGNPVGPPAEKPVQPWSAPSPSGRTPTHSPSESIPTSSIACARPVPYVQVVAIRLMLWRGIPAGAIGAACVLLVEPLTALLATDPRWFSVSLAYVVEARFAGV